MSLTRPFCILVLVLTSQALFAKSPEHIHFKPMFISPPAQQITEVGQNRQPLFISEDSFIFVSKDRRFQKEPQLYFKDLNSRKEKRITYQSGNIAPGAYLEKDNKLIYTSSTDEEKETPFLLKDYLSRFPGSVKNDDFFQLELIPQEIYSSSIDGNDIKRLTHYSGYDGFPAYLPKANRLYFSRWKGGRLGLYATSIDQHLEPWPVAKTHGHDLGLQVSPQQDRFVWFRFSPDFKSSQLLLANTDFKNPKFLTLDTGVSWSAVWHPNGQSVIYSSRTAETRDFDLFEVSASGACQRQITSYAGDEFFPSISPDGKKILFTSTQSGQEQVHLLDYPEDFSCEETPATEG